MQSPTEDQHPLPAEPSPKAPDVVVDRHRVNQVGTSRCPTHSAAKTYLGEVDGTGFLDGPQTFIQSSRDAARCSFAVMTQAQGKRSPGDNATLNLGSGSSAGAGPAWVYSPSAILLGTYFCRWPPPPAGTPCDEGVV